MIPAGWRTATILPDEIGARAVRALIAALRYCPCLSVRLNAVLTDNEACYPFRRFAQVCCRLSFAPPAHAAVLAAYQR